MKVRYGSIAPHVGLRSRCRARFARLRCGARPQPDAPCAKAPRPSRYRLLVPGSIQAKTAARLNGRSVVRKCFSLDPPVRLRRDQNPYATTMPASHADLPRQTLITKMANCLARKGNAESTAWLRRKMTTVCFTSIRPTAQRPPGKSAASARGGAWEKHDGAHRYPPLRTKKVLRSGMGGRPGVAWASTASHFSSLNPHACLSEVHSTSDRRRSNKPSSRWVRSPDASIVSSRRPAASSKSTNW